MQTGHAENLVYADQIDREKHCQHEDRRPAPRKELFQEEIGSHEKHRYMNPCQKKLRTVDADPEQHPETVNKAVHRLGIDALVKGGALQQSVDPRMMPVHIAEAVGMVAKCAVGEIDHAEQHDHRKHHILRNVSPRAL